jgi:hypothetical protein
MSLSPEARNNPGKAIVKETSGFRFEITGSKESVKDFLINLLDATRSSIGSSVDKQYIDEIFNSPKQSEQYTFGGLRFYLTVSETTASFKVWPNSGGDQAITNHAGPILKQAIEKLGQ